LCGDKSDKSKKLKSCPVEYQAKQTSRAKDMLKAALHKSETEKTENRNHKTRHELRICTDSDSVCDNQWNSCQRSLPPGHHFRPCLRPELLRPLPKFLVRDKKSGPDSPSAIVHRLNHCKFPLEFVPSGSDGTMSLRNHLFLRDSVNCRQVFVSPPAMRESHHTKLHDSVGSIDGKPGAGFDILCEWYVHGLFLTKPGAGRKPF
jgi:hypothetical protein